MGTSTKEKIEQFWMRLTDPLLMMGWSQIRRSESDSRVSVAVLRVAVTLGDGSTCFSCAQRAAVAIVTIAPAKFKYIEIRIEVESEDDETRSPCQEVVGLSRHNLQAANLQLNQSILQLSQSKHQSCDSS